MNDINITPKIFQWHAFQTLRQTKPYIANETPAMKILSALSYFALIGGEVSEYNLLNIMKYVGVDIKQDTDSDALQKLLTQYCGAGVIEIIDNGLGIREIFMDPEDPFYQRGLTLDVRPLIKEIELSRNEIAERIVGSAKDGKNRDS